ncbi:vitamin D 25-hydroxylase-like [Uloborus diversus]|uniref:vitamin D 25-hydroxylase-like n=1 Tax=Uloborus diversus TaxID=327109 RepID=UPI002409A13F|nr:vitamin D 25-hydroxylase-like [Uloborus diversus]
MYSWIGSIIVIFVSVILVTHFRRSKYKNFPPGPIGLPILGYLPFLGSEPFRTLHELRRKNGNVFSLYLGQTYVVVLGDYIAVKEAFSLSSTTDRPEKIFDFLPDGVGFSSVNGEEWVEQRRYCVRAMRDLGLGRSNWERSVQAEVEDFVSLIEKQNGLPIDVCKLLSSSVSNNISSLLFGKRLPVGDPTRDRMDQGINVVSRFFSQSGLRLYFPFLVDVLVKLGITEYARIHQKLVDFNRFIREEVQQRKTVTKNEDLDIFIDGYIQEMEKCKSIPGSTFNDKNLCGNVQALLVGGSDTTRTSINWLLLAMASFQHIQMQVHAELDTVLGKEGKITWSERARVPYTFAAIMEGQRWKTVAPINTSRIAMDDIRICGYDIPKGTTIIANNWGLHNDTKYWKDPEVFDPKRFLTEDGKQLKLRPESYVPFSFGKRNCPGETVALMEILLYFATLMQKFEVLPPHGSRPKMDAILGLTYQAVEQKLRFIPRQ